MRDELEARLDNLIAEDVDPDKAQSVLRKLGEDFARRGAWESGMHIKAIFSAGADYLSTVVNSISSAFASIAKVSFDQRTKPQLNKLIDECLVKYDARADFMRGQMDAVLQRISLQSKSVDNYEEKRNMLRGNLRARLTTSLDEADAEERKLHRTQRLAFKYAAWGIAASLIISTTVNYFITQRHQDKREDELRLSQRKDGARDNASKILSPQVAQTVKLLYYMGDHSQSPDTLIPQLDRQLGDVVLLATQFRPSLEFAYGDSLVDLMAGYFLMVGKHRTRLKQFQKDGPRDSLGDEIARSRILADTGAVLLLRLNEPYTR